MRREISCWEGERPAFWAAVVSAWSSDVERVPSAVGLSGEEVENSRAKTCWRRRRRWFQMV